MRRYVAASAPIAVLGPLTLLGLLLLPGSAPVEAGPARTPSADPAALRLLDRAAHAPQEVTYRGTQFVSAWTTRGSTGLVVDVSHVAGRGTSVRTAGTATTPAARSYVPADAGEPSLLGGVSTLTLLGEHFDLDTADPGSVAGRPAEVVVATRPGTHRHAARFWLDRATGLVLRREVYDERGRATRASAFIDLRLGPVDGDDEVGADMDGPRAWPAAIDSSRLAALRRHGWRCPDSLPPSLKLVDARRGGGDYGGIVHLSYSDGLASVSVFEQRGRLLADKLDGYRARTVGGRPVYVRDGVPQRLVWAAGGSVFTVVADASQQTVNGVVRALPAATDDGGPWDRLGRGLDRVASWFNPFG